jgi:hypothetical protein
MIKVKQFQNENKYYIMHTLIICIFNKRQVIFLIFQILMNDSF